MVIVDYELNTNQLINYGPILPFLSHFTIFIYICIYYLISYHRGLQIRVEDIYNQDFHISCSECHTYRRRRRENVNRKKIVTFNCDKNNSNV